MRPSRHELARAAAGLAAVCLALAGCREPRAPAPAPETAPSAPVPAPADTTTPAPSSAPVPPLSSEPAPPPAPSAPAAKAAPEDVAAAVEHLLRAIETSPLTFVRNGTEHTGAAAGKHVRSKYDHYKKQIATPEDFIAKAATKSQLSGKPYLVKLEDGTTQPLAEWLNAKLAAWRAEPR